MAVYVACMSCTPLHVEDRCWLAGSLIPIGFETQTLIHESSHAFAARSMDWKITTFLPLPHIYKDNFYFGRVATNRPTPEISPGNTFLFYLSPTISSSIVFALSDILLSNVVNIKTELGTEIYMLGMLSPYVDASNGFLLGSDWMKFRKDFQLDAWPMDIAMALILTAMSYRIWYHGRHICSER